MRSDTPRVPFRHGGQEGTYVILPAPINLNRDLALTASLLSNHRQADAALAAKLYLLLAPVV